MTGRREFKRIRFLERGYWRSFRPLMLAFALKHIRLSLRAPEYSAATPNELRRERAKLSAVHLPDQDVAALIPILAAFRVQHEALEQSYVGSADPGAAAALDKQRDVLVANIRASMASVLSPGGIAKLHQFIQGEKSHMTIAPLPVGQ